MTNEPFFLILAGIMALMGLVFIAVPELSKRQARRSTHWIAVPAVIRESAVVLDSTESVLDRHSGSEEEKYVSEYYRAKVGYEYVHGGQRYAGDRVRFGNTFSRQPAKAQADVNAFPAGAAVTAWINPAAPRESVLLREASTAWQGLRWTGVGFVVAALAVPFAF